MLLAIAWVTHPSKRRKRRSRTGADVGRLRRVLPAVLEQDRGHDLAQPARALRSTVSPDPRDESSDLYRVQENANLKLNIQQSGPLGKGFGVPINYALPIADVSNFDPMIKYIPHNGDAVGLDAPGHARRDRSLDPARYVDDRRLPGRPIERRRSCAVRGVTACAARRLHHRGL